MISMQIIFQRVSICLMSKLLIYRVLVGTHRRTVRQVRPGTKLNLVAEYKKSAESKHINQQLENLFVHKTKQNGPKRLSNFLKYHFKLIPYYIYTFFWQVDPPCMVLLYCTTITYIIFCTY